MDIAKIATEETHFDDAAEVVLYDANGEPEKDSTGQTVAVFVVSEQSKPCKRIGQRHRTRTMQLLRRYGSFDKIPQAELDEMDAEKVASCITGWRGFESGGQIFPYSAENAVVVVKGLKIHRPAQSAQIESGIAGHADFFANPSAS